MSTYKWRGPRCKSAHYAGEIYKDPEGSGWAADIVFFPNALTCWFGNCFELRIDARRAVEQEIERLEQDWRDAG